MKERSILFSGSMVRAILDGRKTVTRRIVKPKDLKVRLRETISADYSIAEPIDVDALPGVYAAEMNAHGAVRLKGPPKLGVKPDEFSWVSPYGEPGDRLWLKETWQAWRQTSHERDEWEPITKDVRGDLTLSEWFAENGEQRVEYRATSESLGPWTPSIFMPRWASRITLEVLSVRVERLHDIMDEDARAEGLALEGLIKPGHAPAVFAKLWDEINGERAAWASNPFVWRVAFRRLT